MRLRSTFMVLATLLGAAVVVPDVAVSDTTRRAAFGSSLVLRGFEGARLVVRPYALRSLPESEFAERDLRYRYVGVDVSITNRGARTVRDSPTNGASLVTRGGRSLSPELFVDDSCDNFNGSVTIPRGQTRRGCIGFKVPAGAKLRYFELTWNSGFADMTGQWSIPPRLRGR